MKVTDVLNGDPSGIVMDFDGTDAICTLFESDDYAALVPIRDTGFKEMNILIAQDM